MKDKHIKSFNEHQENLNISDVSDSSIDITEVIENGNRFERLFGDLWAWSYFSSFSKDDIEKYYEEELLRVQNKYLKTN